MKILSAEQIRALDKYTIEHEPIASIDLMERAASKLYDALCKLIKINNVIHIFCGMGNNGGDGLAIARMLIKSGYAHVTTYVVHHTAKASNDFQENEARLKNISGVHYIETELRIPKISADAIPERCSIRASTW